jgi:antitoxin YefM
MDLNIREQIRPVTDFRKNTARLLKQLKEDHQPVILTQRGRGVAVIIDVATYERLDYEQHLRSAVREGLNELRQGRVVPHKEVIKEAHQLIHKTKQK